MPQFNPETAIITPPYADIIYQPYTSYIEAMDLARCEKPARLPFIGREDETERLRAIYERALASAHPVSLVVTGSSRVGKGRFVLEALAAAARSLNIRALPDL